MTPVWLTISPPLCPAPTSFGVSSAARHAAVSRSVVAAAARSKVARAAARSAVRRLTGPAPDLPRAAPKAPR